jgi:hypothetical protein
MNSDVHIVQDDGEDLSTLADIIDPCVGTYVSWYNGKSGGGVLPHCLQILPDKNIYMIKFLEKVLFITLHLSVSGNTLSGQHGY